MEILRLCLAVERYFQANWISFLRRIARARRPLRTHLQAGGVLQLPVERGHLLFDPRPEGSHMRVLLPVRRRLR
jgi:hypothetical protein